jgi:hypothetical protein
MHIVSQVEGVPENTDKEGEQKDGPEKGREDQTALQRVLDGHLERTAALKEKSSKSQLHSTCCWGHTMLRRDIALEEIIDSEPIKAQRLMDQLVLGKRGEELEDARRIALLRSGARGWEARSDEIKAEKELEQAEEKYVGRCTSSLA